MFFQLKKTLELPAITNSVDTQFKNKTKLGDIKLWHLYMGHLGYRSLTIFKNLSSRMNFKEMTSSKLCGDCQKDNQTR